MMSFSNGCRCIVVILWACALTFPFATSFVMTPADRSTKNRGCLQQPLSQEEQGSGCTCSFLLATPGSGGNDDNDQPCRRKFMSSGVAILSTLCVSSTASWSADDEMNSNKSTIWLTGKAPQVPGQKAKDPNDTKGTRKDPSFLRSISDCKSQCETASGETKTKTECLSECQDICCTTYEQCTFAIVPRI